MIKIKIEEIGEMKVLLSFNFLRSYKKISVFFLIDVFFNVESESEIHFCRSPLFLEL